MRIGMSDLAGGLVVEAPAAFLARLGAGLGRARAFGAGLTLLRRA
jgi:CRISPR system Cascade subunit CasE